MKIQVGDDLVWETPEMSDVIKDLKRMKSKDLDKLAAVFRYKRRRRFILLRESDESLRRRLHFVLTFAPAGTLSWAKKAMEMADG